MDSAPMKINDDGSLSVRTRLQELFPSSPLPGVVGLTPTLLSPESDVTRTVEVFNNGNSSVFIDFVDTVTVLTGQPIPPRTAWAISGIKKAIYGVAAVAGVDVRVLDIPTEE